VGRRKEVIRRRGENVAPVEIEEALLAHPGVHEAAVVGIPDEKWQERPLATVVVREGASVTPEELRDHLAQTFARWQLPDAWAFVDRVPRTSVGKLNKLAVRQGFAEGRYDICRVGD
jgi:fatty-acyl-CoA synthase